jgi:hypothetical protein
LGPYGNVSRDEQRSRQCNDPAVVSTEEEREPLSQIPPCYSTEGFALFLPVFLGVGRGCLFAMMSGVSSMSSRRLGMVCALLMVSGVVVLGRFTVMVGRVRMMFRSLLVMFGCFLRHSNFLHSEVRNPRILITAATVKVS